MPKPTSKLASKITKPIPPQRTGPLWAGPCGEGPLGGITQSMIGNFLVDRERFRLKYVSGLRAPEGFSKLLEYGQLWHACEESTSAGVEWGAGLEKYKDELLKKYPMDRGEVAKWYMVCKTQYPIYLDHWSRNPDVRDRTPILQEKVFDVPFPLPSGRSVRLRGKWDAVDLIGKKTSKTPAIWLQENKTKGDIDEPLMRRQLKFDLQTMMYLIALSFDTGIEELGEVKAWDGKKFRVPVVGVRYNVIRRPLSGGKGNIKMKEATKNQPAETPEEYWTRLQQYFIEEPEYWFMRWEAKISPEDVHHFQKRCLIPLLEQICDWYEFVTTGDPWRTNPGPEGKEDENMRLGLPYGLHFQYPYGIYNPINDGRETEYDALLESGTESGLRRVNSLFSELQ
jgi:hypothetical protein